MNYNINKFLKKVLPVGRLDLYNKESGLYLEKLIKIFKSNQNLRKVTALVICSSILYFIMCYFKIFPNYLYVLEFIISRLIFIFIVLMLMQIILNLPITQDFKEEFQIFNLDPKDKPFIILLRKYHFQLFLLGFISFNLATTYFVENIIISYVLGIVTFVSVVLYLIQFVVYTKNYLQREIKNSTYTDKRYISTSSIIPTGQTVKKVAVVCIECAKVGVLLGLGAEVGWKLSHGGMNDMSPWRQSAMNHMFPDDRTKIWTESKAAMAVHNRAMGYPHDNIYKTGETIEAARNSISKFPKGKN